MTERDDCIYIAPQDARHWWASPAMHLPLKACSADAITDHQRCSLDAVQYDHSMGTCKTSQVRRSTQHRASLYRSICYGSLRVILCRLLQVSHHCGRRQAGRCFASASTATELPAELKKIVDLFNMVRVISAKSLLRRGGLWHGSL